MKNKNIVKSIVTCDTIKFRIFIEFPNADVDAVWQKFPMTFPEEHIVDTNDTPMNSAVTACLNYIQDASMANKMGGKYNKYNNKRLSKLFKKLKVSIDESCDLMMGCSLIFECKPKDFSVKKVETVRKAVEGVFSKYCVSYKKGHYQPAGIGFACAAG